MLLTSAKNKATVVIHKPLIAATSLGPGMVSTVLPIHAPIALYKAYCSSWQPIS